MSFVYAAEGPAWGIVRTVEPYDRKKILSRLDGAKKAVHQGKEYYTGTARRGPKGRRHGPAGPRS